MHFTFKFFAFLGLLLNVNPGYCQADSLQSKPDISIFIKGHRGESYIPTDIFNRGFELQLSDTGFTIEKSVLCWDFADVLTCLAVRGNRISFDTLKGKEWFRLPVNKALVTLDHIELKKGEQRFRGASFYFNIAPAEEISRIYDTLAKTYAYIPSYRNQFLLPRSLFEKGFTLLPDDSSYTLLSFLVSFDFHDKDEPLSFYCEGNKLNTDIPGYRQALTKLMYKDGITLENIYARKDGKVYRVPDITFSLQR